MGFKRAELKEKRRRDDRVDIDADWDAILFDGIK